MNPINSSYSKGCPELLSSGCITWNGPNIPCLGICTGDCLTKVVHLLASKFCIIYDGLDLTALDLSCLVANPTVGDDDRTIKYILELILDNQCTLKELIDAIDGSSSSDVTLTLNMRCLKIFDDFGNEIPQNLNATLQSLVNKVCADADRISAVEADIVNIQDQIDALPSPITYVEPSIVTCIDGVTRRTSLTVPIVATAVCAIRTDLGSTIDVQEATARQCAGLGSSLGSISGWKSSPANLAQSFNNLWIAYCNLQQRVTEIETTCCAPSCDSIKVGFLTTFDGTTVVLSFTTGAGTTIPTGYTDCGSTLTISNDSGHEFTVDIPLAQGYVTDPIDLSTFTVGEELTFGFNVKLCSDSVNCDKCVTKKVKYVSSGCCVITNQGSEDITITYRTPITTG